MSISRNPTRALTSSIVRPITQAGAGGGVFDIADFIPQDFTAAYFDLDPGSGLMFQDHQGATPVTTAGDPVGLIVPVGDPVGTEMIANGDMSSATGWSLLGNYAITGGKLVATNATAGGYASQTIGAINGRYHKVTFTVESVTGTINVHCGSFGTQITVTSPGEYAFYLKGAGDDHFWFDVPSTTSFVIDSLSVKLASPWCLVQSTSGSRGTYQFDAIAGHYIDLVGKSLATAAHASFTFPAYLGMALARTTAASQQVIYNSGGTANFTFTNQTSTSAITIASQKGGTIHSVPTRSGSFPLNLPVPADLYITAGQTSSYVSGGVRDIPDDVGLLAGELRTVSNDFVGTETTSALSLIMCDCYWYGGFVRMGSAVTAAERQGAANWLKALIGQDALDAQEYDIFAIAGQSNAMGVGSSTTATAVPFGEGVEYIDSGYIRPFKEPMQHGMPGQVALNGSAWGAFCARWYAQTGRRACIVGSAWSGEGLINGSIVDGTWLEGEALTDKLALKLSTALTDVTGTFRGVIYMGGENDSSLSFTAGEYEGYLNDFLVKLRTKTGIADLKLLLCSLDDTTGSPAIYGTMRTAMVNAATNNAGIELIVPFQDYVIGQGLSSDGIHLNQTALNDMGLRAADGAKTVFGL